MYLLVCTVSVCVHVHAGILTQSHWSTSIKLYTVYRLGQAEDRRASCYWEYNTLQLPLVVSGDMFVVLCSKKTSSSWLINTEQKLSLFFFFSPWLLKYCTQKHYLDLSPTKKKHYLSSTYCGHIMFTTLYQSAINRQKNDDTMHL